MKCPFCHNKATVKTIVKQVMLDEEFFEHEVEHEYSFRCDKCGVYVKAPTFYIITEILK